MTVEYLPVGIACNISCGYCYQDPMRDAGNISQPRNWERAKSQIDKLGRDFAVFGGEPLLAPISHLEEVWKYGFERFGVNGLQTNGSLITDEHIELFKTYNVQVGISIDGPGALNSVRCANDLTEKTELAIRKLCDQYLYPSIITTIHRGNSDLTKLTPWFDSLARMGVRYLNLHELEVEEGKHGLALSEEDNIRVFSELYKWSRNSTLLIAPFCDIKTLLTQINPQVTCTWNHCDPITTAAVQGISPSGDMSNCGRTNKDGVNWIKGDKPGFERYLALYHTPQEFGGCKDCSYFVFCKGHCPGTAIAGDWRNRTVNCKFWYSLFSHIEKDLGDSILSSCDRKGLLNSFMHFWTGNAHADTPHGDSHGDHTDRGIPAVILDKSPL